jgi:hypothetical protein
LSLRLIEKFLNETLTGNHKIQEKKKKLFHRCMTGLQNPKIATEKASKRN